ncbi:MAG: hypothetical protein KDA41_06035, partial [Planctomycetales bacterium]|nr:hypothetical protein [Planctomycetales bacterium]
AGQRAAAVERQLKDLAGMTLTVIDGDFPREVLARKNLQFGEYRMPSRRNKAESYDVKSHAPSGPREGVLKLGALSPAEMQRPVDGPEVGPRHVAWTAAGSLGLLGAALVGLGLAMRRRDAAVRVG